MTTDADDATASEKLGAADGSRVGFFVRDARKTQRLSLEQLAQKAGVSRAMISRIEREEAVPTTTVLAKLAEALGLTFSQLMSRSDEQEILRIPAKSQPVLRDEDSGFVRRCLSPVLPGRGIDFVLNTLPPRATAGDFGAHKRGVEEYIYVQTGRLKAVIGSEVVTLEEGDSLYFQADANHSFINVGACDCVYFLIIDSARLKK